MLSIYKIYYREIDNIIVSEVQSKEEVFEEVFFYYLE